MRIRCFGALGATVMSIFLAYAGGAGRGDKPQYQSLLIKDVPHVRQKPDFCGEACAEMYLRKLGYNVSQDQVFDVSGLSPLLGRGCYTAELNEALKKLGFKTGEVWRQVKPAKAAEELTSLFRELHADLARGLPSIVCTHYGDKPDSSEHFRLILGYDSKTDEVIYHEPAQKDGAYRRMTRSEFLKLWPLKASADALTVIRMRLEPGKIIVPSAAKGFTSADYAQHFMQLKPKLPNDRKFTMVLQPPFVVIGDEAEEVVRRRAADTVKFAVDRLKQDYFKDDPAEILDIWLFRDKESYEKYTRKLFNDTPTTPYGYYSESHSALIMNIATGGGTLVHEIVHPFMHANFPACPAWFNEGLGSLYEQSGDRNGHIRGFTNWRLAGLQKAIKADSVPSFEKLLSASEEDFYKRDPGTNYSQSRYLCYYLQENGLLVRFYREFTAHQKDDPSGVATLKKVLGEEDLGAFKKKWEQFVEKLTFL
jgi:hypothetical protein